MGATKIATGNDWNTNGYHGPASVQYPSMNDKNPGDFLIHCKECGPAIASAGQEDKALSIAESHNKKHKNADKNKKSLTSAYTPTCRHCHRNIMHDGDAWVDPNAKGDDSMWRETCDSNDTFNSPHEPNPAKRPDPVWHSEKMGPLSPPRNEHLNSKKSSLWKRIKNKVAGGNSDNFLETCPICGRDIPKSQMENHMEKYHPHEVRRHETTSTKKTANPFDSDSNPFSPGTDTGAAAAPDITTPMTSPPRTKPATNPMAPDMPQAPAVMPVMPQVPGQTMPEMPGGNAGNDTKQGFASKRASKIADIAVGIMDSNPGINEDRAIYLATKTVNEYPNMIHESRGGADWISTDGMSQCPQCGKEALDEEEGRCHFCGYQQAHKNVEGFDPLAGPTTMTPAKSPITGNPGLR